MLCWLACAVHQHALPRRPHALQCDVFAYEYPGYGISHGTYIPHARSDTHAVYIGRVSQRGRCEYSRPSLYGAHGIRMARYTYGVSYREEGVHADTTPCTAHTIYVRRVSHGGVRV